MKTIRNYLNGALSLSMAMAAVVPARAQQMAPRPPQYVWLAFDVSK